MTLEAFGENKSGQRDRSWWVSISHPFFENFQEGKGTVLRQRCKTLGNTRTPSGLYTFPKSNPKSLKVGVCGYSVGFSGGAVRASLLQMKDFLTKRSRHVHDV